MRLDLAVLEKLVCPATRTRLRFDAERQELVSDEAGIAYPVRDGTPILLIEEARQLEHFPKKWEPVFRSGSAQDINPEDERGG